MTGLKNYHADDIATSMSELLSDKSFNGIFRKASINKIALTLDEVKIELTNAKDPNEKWNQMESNILEQENKEPGFYGKAREILRKIQAGKKDAPGTETIEVLKGDDQDYNSDSSCSMDIEDQLKLTTAIHFTIKRLNKIANALDIAGFPGIAKYIDKTSSDISKRRPKISNAQRSYQGWIQNLNSEKAPKETIEAFKKRYKGALGYAKKKDEYNKSEAEEYAIRTAIDKLPKKYLKEPTKYHGPGKSGKLAK